MSKVEAYSCRAIWYIYPQTWLILKIVKKPQHMQCDVHHNSKYSILLCQVTTRNVNMSQRLNQEIFDHN